MFFFDSSSDVQETIIKADRPGRQAFPLAGPRVCSSGEQPAGDPEELASGQRCGLPAQDRQDSREWDTFRFSSWLLGELSKHSDLPGVTRRLTSKGCFNLLGWLAGVSFFIQGF